jgi:hypothetical protein
MAITRIGNPAIADQRGVNFRNIIINGDMSIAQRGTSATALGNGDNGYHTCDRWRFFESGAPTAEFTMSQSTDVPSGQGFATSLKLDCTTAQTSLASSDVIRIEQRIEGQNLQYLKKGTANAESVTCSFWVKSSKTGTFIVELNDSDNLRQISKSYTINSANTWEKKTITYDGDTTGTLDNDSNNSIRFEMFLLAGTDFTSGTLATTWQANDDADRAVGQVNLADSTSNEWYITGVQLEAGSVASDFEFLPHDVNLQRCFRYYEGGDGNDNAVNIYGITLRLCETIADFTGRMKIFGAQYFAIKRATPTLTLYGDSGFTTANRINVYNDATDTETVTSISGTNANTMGQYIGLSGTANSGKTYKFYYEADAEL